MPRTIILQANGSFLSVIVPDTAQQLVCSWLNQTHFPEGVELHIMMHLTQTMANSIGVKSLNNVPQTVSLSLMVPRNNQKCFQEANYHELPKLLDTQLFFGNLLLVMTLDGSTILPLSCEQFQTILKMDVSSCLTTHCSSSWSNDSWSQRSSSFVLSDCDADDFSNESDIGGPMELSSDNEEEFDVVEEVKLQTKRRVFV